MLSDFDTDTVFPTHSTFMEWCCIECNQRWNASVKDRINGKNCPYCEGRKAIPGRTSAKALYPKLFEDEYSESYNALLVGVNPDLLLPSSTKPVIWNCSCRNIYQMSIRDRIRKLKRDRTACNVCNSRKPRLKFYI